MSIDKLDLQSPDMVNENFEKLATLFPNCVTESADGKTIDFDLLKQELSHAVVEGNKERYRLEWPGKREAIVTANLPTTKTLRPVHEDSVDFNNTENLYIEGDNLEVLKLLQESYMGKVKMIYIDPPYNTGKDFVYKDNFTQDSEEYIEESGQMDEYNQRLVINPETAGRYHSNWLSMIYPRLKLARNLLSNDGVIFISIDDKEVDNIRKACNEVFGEMNFISQNVRVSNSAKNSSSLTSVTHDYTLIYAKSKLSLAGQNWQVDKKNIKDFLAVVRRLKKQGLSNEEISSELRVLVKYPRFYEFDHYYYVDDNFEKLGPYASDKPGPASGNIGHKNYSLKHPKTLCDCKIPSTGWAMDESKALKMLDENRWHFGKDENTIPRPKAYLFEKAKSKFTGIQFFDSQKDVKLLQKLEIPFDFPKPADLIKELISLMKNDCVILDFFSGSATTAHAIMNLNSEDGGSRKYIMVQLPELTPEKSEAYKAGYKNICEIGKERIRRAAKKIKEETNADIDYGFRVYRLDESNMQDVYYKPQDYQQANLDLFSDNVKPDRTADDLLAQVMLDWGLPLSLKIEQVKVTDKKVYKVAGDSLYACFDKGIDEAFAKEIAKETPMRIVFRDNGFKDDTAKVNVQQLLKQLSPETEMKVI